MPRISCLLIASVVSAIDFDDICQLYFESESALPCSDSGMCRNGADEIACEDAFTIVAHRLSPALLPALPGGQIYQPQIIHNMKWPIPFRMKPGALGVEFDQLIDSLAIINGELDHWAPRVVYVPDRVGGVLRDAYEIVQYLNTVNNGVHVGYISHLLDASTVVSEFAARIVAMTQSVLNMPDLRRNGYLNMLIPYLHIFSEINYSFVLNKSAPLGFLVSEPALLLTVAQFHPGYLAAPVWKFRLVNEDALPWGEYQAERFLLPMHAQVELRTPLASIGDSNTRFGEYLAQLRGIESDEILANVMHLFEAMNNPEWMRIMVNNFCEATRLVDHIVFSDFTRSRAEPVLLAYFRSCVSLKRRVMWAATLVVELDEFAPPEHFTDMEESDPPSVMTRIMLTASVPELHDLLACVSPTGWLRKFVQSVVLQNLAQADNGLLVIIPSATWGTRRAIGRALGYLIFEGDPDGLMVPLLMQNCQKHSEWLHVMFFRSSIVREGFYDWYNLNAFENFLTIEELPHALYLLMRE